MSYFLIHLYSNNNFNNPSIAISVTANYTVPAAYFSLIAYVHPVCVSVSVLGPYAYFSFVIQIRFYVSCISLNMRIRIRAHTGKYAYAHIRANTHTVIRIHIHIRIREKYAACTVYLLEFFTLIFLNSQILKN